MKVQMNWGTLVKAQKVHFNLIRTVLEKKKRGSEFQKLQPKFLFINHLFIYLLKERCPTISNVAGLKKEWRSLSISHPLFCDDGSSAGWFLTLLSAWINEG